MVSADVIGRVSGVRGAALAGFLVLAACASQPPPAPPPPPPGGALFNSVLSEFGSWDRVDGIGEVWRPSRTVVGIGFVPYVSDGHWAWSEDGWVFLSDFPWGWATFHYGRWSYASAYGWQWAPDSRWAAAWVDWRYGGGYVSWSPVAPAGLDERQRWHVVETRHFTRRDLMPKSVSETAAISAALERSAPVPGQPPEFAPNPFPPKELVESAIGRAVPEPTGLAKKRERQARNAFGAPKPATPAKVEPSEASMVAAASPPPATSAAPAEEEEPRKRAKASKRTKGSKHRKKGKKSKKRRRR